MKIALTGATGFVGRHISASLAGQGLSVRMLTRPQAGLIAPGGLHVVGDLRTGEGLSGLVDGCDVVVHAASYVGADEGLQWETNVRGTERLLAAAGRAGVRRTVYLSTAGVYGGGFSAGGDERTLRPSPRSALSASRYEAEQRVLAQGGVVVRPNMVVGAGDTWFLLPLLALLGQLGAWIEDGRPRVSVVNVETLGAVIATLAIEQDATGVYHVANPKPATIRELVAPVYAHLGVPEPSRSLTADAARQLLLPRGARESRLAIIARDNWFHTDRIWRLLPELQPTTPLTMEDIAWYGRTASDTAKLPPR